MTYYTFPASGQRGARGRAAAPRGWGGLPKGSKKDKRKKREEERAKEQRHQASGSFGASEPASAATTRAQGGGARAAQGAQRGAMAAKAAARDALRSQFLSLMADDTSLLDDEASPEMYGASKAGGVGSGRGGSSGGGGVRGAEVGRGSITPLQLPARQPLSGEGLMMEEVEEEVATSASASADTGTILGGAGLSLGAFQASLGGHPAPRPAPPVAAVASPPALPRGSLEAPALGALGGGGRGEDAAAGLVALALAVGRMEERLSSKLERVAALADATSLRLSAVEAALLAQPRKAQAKGGP